MFVDIHAHLGMAEFDSDREAVIFRAYHAEVEALIVVGYDLDSSRKAVALAEAYPQVYATVGIHPHGARNTNETIFQELHKMAFHPKVVAIGETGLDYYRNLSPRSLQEGAFRYQIGLAHELNLPLVIHNRWADDEVMRILKEEKAQVSVFHCFSSDLAFAWKCVELGFYLSLAGTLTYPQGNSLSEVVRHVPMDRLLLETDSPYLTPEPYRGRRNEPAYLVEIAKKVAEIRGLDMKEVATATSLNASRLFKSFGLEGAKGRRESHVGI